MAAGEGWESGAVRCSQPGLGARAAASAAALRERDGRFVGGREASRPSPSAPRECLNRATLALSRADLPQLGKASRGAFSSPIPCSRPAVGHSSVHTKRTPRGAAGRARGPGVRDERLARSPPIIAGEAEAEGALLKPGG